MYEIEKINSLYFPTKDHERFVHHIVQRCNESHIAGFLKGSLAKGTAQEFSDVDLMLAGLNIPEDIDALIASFGSILMSEKTAISTFMVIYDCGLTVEYDIRKTVTMADVTKSISLSHAEYQLSDIPRDRVIIETSTCPRRNKAYSAIMIVQMCCAKLLCHKQELSKDIYCDRMNLLYGASALPAGFDQRVHTESLNQFVKRLKNQAFSSDNLSAQMINYFSHLFNVIENG